MTCFMCSIESLAIVAENDLALAGAPINNSIDVNVVPIVPPTAPTTVFIGRSNRQPAKSAVLIDRPLRNEGGEPFGRRA